MMLWRHSTVNQAVHTLLSLTNRPAWFTHANRERWNNNKERRPYGFPRNRRLCFSPVFKKWTDGSVIDSVIESECLSVALPDSPETAVSAMIVFSGPTTGPSRTGIEWSNLGNPAEEPVWIIKYGNPDRSMQPVEELSKQKHVNLSDLANITVDVLCPLQLIYQNLTDDEWVNVNWNWNDFALNLRNIFSLVKGLGIVQRQHQRYRNGYQIRWICSAEWRYRPTRMVQGGDDVTVHRLPHLGLF